MVAIERAKKESVTPKRYADEVFLSGLLSGNKTITKKKSTINFIQLL